MGVAEEACSVNVLVPAPGAARVAGANVALKPIGKPITENPI